MAGFEAAPQGFFLKCLPQMATRAGGLYLPFSLLLGTIKSHYLQGMYMGYSIKNLENAAKNVNERLEAHSRQQGEEMASRVLASTSGGRGLWCFILWPAFLMIFLMSGYFFCLLLSHFGLKPPLSFAGFVVGFIFARNWYQLDFTIRHPFWGSVAGYLGTGIVALTFLERL